MINIPSVGNLKEIVRRIKVLIPTKVSELENDKGYKTIDTTYEIGTDDTSGLTKLYNEIGSNTDGTITQKIITDIYNEIQDEIAILKDAYDADGGTAFNDDIDYENDFDGGGAIK